ncbi:hypothetical protein Tco_1130679, partial [Tanacetum coccineum]
PRGVGTVLLPSPKSPPDHRSTVINGGEPPLTTAGPPRDHWSTAADHQSTSGSWPGQVWYWDGSSRVLVRVKSGLGPGLDRVGSGLPRGMPRGAMCQLTWHGWDYIPPA